MRGGGDDDGRQRFTRRAVLLGAGQLALFGGLGARLYELQVVDGARYRPLSDLNRIDTQTLAAVRGRLFDRAGIVLADNREGFRATLVPALAGDVRAVLERLAAILPVPRDRREQIVARARRQNRNLPIVVADGLTFEQVARINVLAPQLPGVRAETVWLRTYAHGDTMGHVVGYVGSVDRQALEDPDPALRLPGMRVGKAGAELGVEHDLRGTRGTLKLEVDARGRPVRNLEQVDPVPGRDVTLTVDQRVQARVLQRLSREKRAAVVALDVTNGEVLALASVPTFDPGAIAGRVTQQSWRRLAAIANQPMLNRATAGVYPPGSTFKIVTALAGLHAGVVQPADFVRCEGEYELGGRAFRCWSRKGHGRVDMRRALTESCDVFFYELAHKTGIDAISDMARYLGLGQVLGSDIALQKSGVIPDQDWKRGNLGRSWLGGETLLAGIGQGYVTATPLQLAVMTARVATGRAVVPTLVRRTVGEVHGSVGGDASGAVAARDMSVPGSDGVIAAAAASPPAQTQTQTLTQTQTKAQAQAQAAQASGARAEFEPLRLDPRWLDVVRRGMIGVVNDDGGTGSAARVDRDGYVVAGKTGTSQVSRVSTDRQQADLDWQYRDHALFVAYAPAASPRYAIAAVVEHGGGGGATAAPLVRDVLDILLEHEAGRSEASPPSDRQSGTQPGFATTPAVGGPTGEGPAPTPRGSGGQG